MTKDLFTRQHYNIIGPGGVKCPCCNDYHGKSKSKLNRVKRRKLRNETNNEIKFYYEERKCING